MQYSKHLYISFPIILQDAAFTILMPDWLRMSSFLIRKLRNLNKNNKNGRRVDKEKEKLREKEE